MNKYLVGSLAGVAIVVAFFVGRCTYPVPADFHPRIIDSLNTSLAVAIRLRDKYLADGKHAYERGKAEQKTKIIHHTVYRIDTAEAHTLPKHEKDSLIKVRLEVPQADSSTFTNPVADGILDISLENTMLKKDAEVDSTTIGLLMNAYASQDSAKNVSDRILANREAVIEVKDHQIRKQKVLKFVFLGLAVLAVLF